MGELLAWCDGGRELERRLGSASDDGSGLGKLAGLVDSINDRGAMMDAAVCWTGGDLGVERRK